MMNRGPSTLESLRAGLKEMYVATTPEAGRLRATQLSAVIRLTPQTMTANIIAGGAVVWTYMPQVPDLLWAWFGVLFLVCVFALTNWWSRRDKSILTIAPRAVHRATLHAVVLSGIWAVMPVVWFPEATHGQQLVLATLVTGMIGAGGLVLHPLPYASAAYILIISLASLGAILHSEVPAYAAIGLLLCAYSPMVFMGAMTAWRKSTALVKAELYSMRQEQTLSVLLTDFEQNAGDSLWETDAQGRLVHISPKLCALLHIDLERATRLPLIELLHKLDGTETEAVMKIRSARNAFKDLILTFQTPDGPKYIQFNGKVLLTDSGAFAGWRGVASDVTEKIQSTNLLRQLAHTDYLTGLTNRFKFREFLAELIEGNHPAALLAIDLDRFKTINDQHGHSTGDEVLKLVSQRLQQHIGEQAMVARLGGDEFAVVLSTADSIEGADALARRVITLLQDPLTLADRRLVVGGSVGLTISAGHISNIDELMVQADIALYAAKDAGRGQCVRYTEELGAVHQRRATVEQSLRKAMHRQELQLHWQPKVDIKTWQIVGAETLMRWRHPTLGWVNPGEFIPIAEQSGMISALGSWALLETCRMHSSALAGLKVSVNVSSMQLRDERFLALLQDALEEFHVNPAQLELELTESVFLDSADQALAMLHAIKKTGVKLAMDDFGTGYSSLSYLRSFPFDTLKIDRAFVIELVEKKDAEAVVHMITGLAQTLGMRTVCEGVETLEQLNAIRRAGCDEVQGYLIAKPMPLQEFVVFRENWNQGSAALH